MASRYLIRRSRYEDLADLQNYFGHLEERLGNPGPEKSRVLTRAFNTVRFAHFRCKTLQTPKGWVWICPAIEIEAEDDAGLKKLGQEYGVWNAAEA